MNEPNRISGAPYRRADGPRPSLAFAEPASVQAAEDRLFYLQTSTSEIRVQLSDRNRTTPDGRRLTAKEFSTWRRSAVAALQAKEAELLFVKRWLRRHRESRDSKLREALVELVAAVETTREVGADVARSNPRMTEALQAAKAALAS